MVYAKSGASESEFGGTLYGVQVTGNGNNNLVADSSKQRVAVFSANGFLYQTQWLAPGMISAGYIAQRPTYNFLVTAYNTLNLY